MKHLILSALLSLATGCLIPGGSIPENCLADDGLDVCDGGPLNHIDLDGGRWCTDANPIQTCLSVTHLDSDPPSVSHYLLEQGFCYEHGILSGGLEFQPSQPRSVPCLPAIPEVATIYSASGDWTAIGITLYVNYSDGTAEGTSEITKLVMHYVP